MAETYVRALKKDSKASDKLLDVVGPLTQSEVITDEVISQGSPPDPLILWDRLQRCICLLGNADAALSAKRRHAVLLCIDPQLTDMAEQNLGPEAEGLLFGHPFINELSKHAASYVTMTKVETSLRKVKEMGSFFHRAGCQWGRASSQRPQAP